MVAKINHGEKLFGAVVYNQNKVDAGTARIIAGNKMVADVANDSERQMRLTMLAFENHLLANRNTEKPILHISLNPSLDDSLSDTQFASLAHGYMHKMGYGEQPYIVYLHEDTGRRHIHIVSVCVDELGRKIDDRYEWRRSMKVCRELEREYGLANAADKERTSLNLTLGKADPLARNAKHEIGNILKALYPAYGFRSFGEWSALLSRFNIRCELVRGEFGGVPYNGIVYTITDDNGIPVGEPMKSSLIGKSFGYEGLKRRMARSAKAHRGKKPSAEVRRTIAFAMHGSHGNREEFIRRLQEADIDVVFRKNDRGRIYGVTFIDHGNRDVFNGSRMGKEFSANAFDRLFRTAEPEQVEAEHPKKNASMTDTMESVIEQALGVLSLGEAGGDSVADDAEEEAFAREMRNRTNKRKRRKRGI